MSACTKCQRSGSMPIGDNDYADCIYCDAAEQRVALARWTAMYCQHMTREQRDWAIYQHAMQMAAYREREE